VLALAAALAQLGVQALDGGGVDPVARQPAERRQQLLVGVAPAWIQPPADMVPGIVPVELILARTPQRAIGLTGIRAYPNGFGCTLHLRLREVILAK
jgi:hypothetical protein